MFVLFGMLVVSQTSAIAPFHLHAVSHPASSRQALASIFPRDVCAAVQWM
jgi:hypothetical protein